MDALLPAVAEELLKEVKKAFQETSQIPDELLLSLKFVFGASALHALDLVDHRSVTRFTSPSGRTVFPGRWMIQVMGMCVCAVVRRMDSSLHLTYVITTVLGSSGKLYTCYAFCHYCSCPAFAFSVLRRDDSLLCKHILAMYLSQAVGACQERTVSDKQMSHILLSKEEEE